MLVVDEVKVRPLSTKSAEVSWTIVPTNEPIVNSRFRVLRAESPEGPYEDVSGPVVNSFTFVDGVNLRQKFTKISYRIQVDDITTGLSEIYPQGTYDEAFIYHPDFVRSVGPEEYGPDFISLEIARRNNLLLRRFIGRLCAYFPVRTQGQRCPTCFDQIKMRSKLANCPECYGTSFQGGYYGQINIFVDVSPSPKVVEVSTSGRMNPRGSVMWIANFPSARPGDVIVEKGNRRWKVDRVNNAQHKRYTVQQYLNVHEVDRGDPEFLIPADLDLRHPDEDFVGFFPTEFSPKVTRTEGSGLL